MRLLELAVGEKWAMTEPMLRTVLEITARENESLEAVEARLGKPLDNTRTVTYRDTADGRKIAIIPVVGPIARRANLFSDISGGTSIDVLAQDFRSALTNPTVASIIFNVDSPGGTVNGLHELAEMVHAARGTKPMTTYVGHMAASAAYWFGSSTDEIVIDRTAGTGSLGVVAVLPDPTKKNTKDLEIVSSQSPNKRPNLATEQGRSVIQKEVDTLADIFVEKVAKYRGVSTDYVLEHFGQGGMLIGEEAVAAGMADRIGSLEGLISEMAMPSGYKSPRHAAQEKRMSEQTFLSRIGAYFGFGGEQKEAATADEVIAAAEIQKQEFEAMKQENERLAAELAARNEERAAEAQRIEEERSARIEAEVSAAVAEHGERLGRDAEKAFATLLREAKVADAKSVEAGLLAFVETLPVVGQSERKETASIDPEDVAAKAAGTLDPSAALNASIEATLIAQGLKKGSAEWGAAFHAEFNRIRSEAKQ